MRGVLPAVVGPPAAHGRGARAKPVVLRSHAQARRAALGAGAAGPLEPAFNGLESIGHPARAFAPPAGKIAQTVQLAPTGLPAQRRQAKDASLPSFGLARVSGSPTSTRLPEENAPFDFANPTASLTQNDLPSTTRQAHIGERKGYKDAQNTPQGSQK
jgi:hypothetical protein